MNLKLEWSKELLRGGDGRYPEYRIPGVAVTGRGTILCCAEARTQLRDDWNRIDLLLLRSPDDGASWRTVKLDLPAEMGKKPDDTLNNPTFIVDGGAVHLLFHQNYSRAFISSSVDDGLSWSVPREITDAFRMFPVEWNCCATGPGHGLCTRTGRLIAPIWIANGAFEDPQGIRRAHEPSVSGCVYSDDHGLTWRAGALITGQRDANETTVAERPDGSILYNFRTRYTGLRRTLAVSEDGVSGFSKIWIEDALRDPMCFGSMVNLPSGGIAFVNCDVGEPDSSHPDQFVGEDGRTARINLSRAEYGARENLTVKLSPDGGISWEVLTKVDDIAGYADIAAAGNALYVFYEFGPWQRRVVERLILKKYVIE